MLTIIHATLPASPPQGRVPFRPPLRSPSLPPSLFSFLLFFLPGGADRVSARLCFAARVQLPTRRIYPYPGFPRVVKERLSPAGALMMDSCRDLPFSHIVPPPPLPPLSPPSCRSSLRKMSAHSGNILNSLPMQCCRLEPDERFCRSCGAPRDTFRRQTPRPRQNAQRFFTPATSWFTYWRYPVGRCGPDVRA